MKGIVLIVVCLTVVSAGIFDREDDKLNCEGVAKQIVAALRKQTKPYTNLESKKLVFFHDESVRYDVDVDNISLQGMQFASIDKVSGCKQIGKNSTTMIINVNLKNAMLTGKVTFKERRYNGAEATTFDVTAFSVSDLVYSIHLNYNSKYKQVAPIYVHIVSASNFVSYSDCGHDIPFCDRLHQRLDASGWSNVLTHIPIVTKQVLSSLRL